MGKKKKTNPQSKPIQNKKEEKPSNTNIKGSLVKTYAILGGLILSYFILTFSTNSIDKKMDKIANSNTEIVYKLTVDNNILLLSQGDNFLGVTRYTSLPLGRVSIRESKSETNSNLITYSFRGENRNNLVIGGENKNYKEIIFTDVTDDNGVKITKETTISIPSGDIFLVSAPYTSSYENIKVITNDNTVIDLK